MRDLTREQVAELLYNKYHDGMQAHRTEDQRKTHSRTPWAQMLSNYPNWAAAWLELADEVVGKGYKP